MAIKQRLQNLLIIFTSIAGAATCGYLLYKDVYISRSSADGLSKAGIVDSKQKSVKRKLGDNMVWDLIDRDEDLYWNDSLETGPKSQAHITLKDGNKIVLGESSLIVLEHEDNKLSLNLKSGQLVVDTDRSGLASTAEFKINGATVSKKAGESLSIQIDELKGEVKATTQQANGSARQIVIDSKGQVSEVEIPASLEKPTALEQFFSDLPSANIAFKWQSKKAAPQTFEVARDKEFKTLVTARNSTASETELALAPGSYYWRVKVPTDKGLFITAIRSFDVVQTKIPEQLLPIDKAAIKYRQDLPLVEFSWQGLSTAERYIFELSKNSGFTDVLVKQETPNNFFRTSKVIDGSLFWRVTAIYGQEKRESVTQNLIIKKNVNVAPPPLLFPDADFKVTFDFFSKSKGIPFRWKSEASETYRFVFSRSKNMEVELVSFETTQSETLVADTYPTGTYFWSVGHRDEKGDWQYSSPRSIVLGPLVPILTPPAILSESGKSEYDLLKNPKLRWAWSKVQGAKEYKFKLFRVKGDPTTYVKDELVFEDTLDGLEKTKNDLDDGTYKWVVSAIDNFGRESTPTEHKFNVIHGRTLEAPDFDMSGVQ
jgi:hypothetical protein